ncbi:MAG: CRISPR-associated endonuclease Cas3'' [Hyphomonadaceae bacterium]
MIYAHSIAERPVEEWELLSHHLRRVAAKASEFAEVFGWAGAAHVAGLLHDIGKMSREYQAYISQPRQSVGSVRGPDHSTAGAREALKAYPEQLSRMLAFAIAGHHAGLADGLKLDDRISEDYAIKSYSGWQEHTGPLPDLAALKPSRPLDLRSNSSFSKAFLVRMLFSCLVDADFLETEAFYAEHKGESVERGGHASLTTLRDRLRDHMAAVGAVAPDTPVNRLRSQVLAHAVSKADLKPGLFTLTVPTGGGKTLASLSFALEHAARHALRRVVYVIPFTSIIEQTAAVFRAALDANQDVLEHHSSFDWEQAGRSDDGDDEGPEGLSKLRRAAENWDAPIVVTTAVQFFESLFASRTSRCRTLHNLAGAVSVLDEAQTLPIDMLLPCMAAIDELARNYGASIVLCTATQPALRKIDGFKDGLDVDEARELAPDPRGLYQALKRVRVETMPASTTDAEIAARFAEQDHMLCIVNTRAHARALFDAIRNLPGATYMTTLMCPRHRRKVLEEVRSRLDPRHPLPVRLVATSLIEAGVDVDFPEVWRAAAGLDSIAQAAGRCNREGRLDIGRTVVFTPADAKPPRQLKVFWQAARQVIDNHREDLLGLDAIRAYFGELYWQQGRHALDTLEIDGRRGVLAAIAERKDDLRFPFRSIAEAFRLIDEVMAPVIVPWDEEAKEILRAIGAADRPPAVLLRRLQQYIVGIPPKARGEWLRLGALKAVHVSLGEELLMFADKAHYREDIGVDLANFDLR